MNAKPGGTRSRASQTKDQARAGAQPSESDPLASLAGRVYLTRALVEAERELVDGPAATGWQFNEAKRPSVEERVAFLKALLALLPAIDNPKS